mmetsp:Transcript_42787/g.114492  ORF Transcript_42787/g.114492 Transcript_42787/m.114492 type:complete len:271 (+) Transcript_42787:498-1310(+)
MAARYCIADLDFQHLVSTPLCHCFLQHLAHGWFSAVLPDVFGGGLRLRPREMLWLHRHPRRLRLGDPDACLADAHPGRGCLEDAPHRAGAAVGAELVADFRPHARFRAGRLHTRGLRHYGLPLRGRAEVGCGRRAGAGPRAGRGLRAAEQHHGRWTRGLRRGLRLDTGRWCARWPPHALGDLHALRRGVDHCYRLCFDDREVCARGVQAHSATLCEEVCIFVEEAQPDSFGHLLAGGLEPRPGLHRQRMRQPGHGRPQRKRGHHRGCLGS